MNMNMYKHFYIYHPRIKKICMCNTSFLSTAAHAYIEGHWELFCAEDALCQVYTDRLYVTLL